MTSSFGVPQVKKWPFVIGDFVLLAAAGWIFRESGYHPAGWNLAMIVACIGLGVFFSILPFLAEFREESRRFDSQEFRSTLEQIKELESVGKQITDATAQWQQIQDQCQHVVQSADAVASKTQAETDRLIEITEKADTRERDHLRLEVEKQRRGEREWLEVLVGILDHVFALHRAAVRSGQEKLIRQIEGFRDACYEICRRVGLSQYVVQPGESFNPKIHKVLDGHEVPESGVVEDTLAPGFSYQGHPIRMPMVAVRAGAGPAEDVPAEEASTVSFSSAEPAEEAGSDEAEGAKDPDLFDDPS